LSCIFPTTKEGKIEGGNGKANKEGTRQEEPQRTLLYDRKKIFSFQGDGGHGRGRRIRGDGKGHTQASAYLIPLFVEVGEGRGALGVSGVGQHGSNFSKQRNQ